MKLFLKLSFVVLLLSANQSYSQDNFNFKLKDVNGQEVNFADLIKTTDTPVVVSFWATWCIPCIAELDNINDEYKEWQAKTPFKFLAISIDDSRTAYKIKSFKKGKDWQFGVFNDVNGDLKRNFSVTDPPHTMIFKNGKIVYRHTGYLAGDEENLLAEIQKHK